jgi:hypothetical protein
MQARLPVTVSNVDDHVLELQDAADDLRAASVDCEMQSSCTCPVPAVDVEPRAVCE